jgi:glycosyltransferase involved in cell wall biosynthesis
MIYLRATVEPAGRTSMHNITKIKIFRILLGITWLPSLIILGPLALMRKKSSTGLFFFFDRYAMGGAQKVYLDILEAVEDIEKDLFFTRASPDDTLKRQFEASPNTGIHHIRWCCEPIIFRLFSVHYFAFYINRHRGARVLGSNSTFFYDLLPFLSKSVFTIELLHNFTYGKRGMEFFGLLNHRFLSVRAVIDDATRQNIIKQYQTTGIGNQYVERIRLIEFGVTIPTHLRKNFEKPLQIVYAGRGGPQKRIHLINLIAEYFIRSDQAVAFHFAGTAIDDLSTTVKENSRLHGLISDDREMIKIFTACHVLLMTSAYEGFPMVIKESMANGCVPVVTGLAGIRSHLLHGSQSLLIDELINEPEIVREAIAHIEYLLENRQVLEELSGTCHEYARLHFDKTRFREQYRALLQAEQPAS